MKIFLNALFCQNVQNEVSSISHKMDIYLVYRGKISDYDATYISGIVLCNSMFAYMLSSSIFGLEYKVVRYTNIVTSFTIAHYWKTFKS